MAQSPRAGHESVAGVPWLARMIDKARLDAAGEIDALDLEYPCPSDRSVLRELGLDARTFQRIAVENPSDEAVVRKLREAGASLPVG